MKKLLVLVVTMVLSVSVFAEKIAVVNTQEVFQKYSQTKKVQKKLEREKTKLEKQLAGKAQKLQKEAERLNAKGEKVTTAEKDKFQREQTQFAKSRQSLQMRLSRLEQKEMVGIQNSIKSAITRVAQKKKYDIVLERGAAPYGGVDITSEVIKTLESTKKINLK